MSQETTAPASPQFDEFLTNFGKTLSRINLYTPNHPMVQESVKNSFDALNSFLKLEPEIILASSEGKLLLNGTILGGLVSIQQMLLQFFEKNQIYSLTFKAGLAPEEMNSFYKLFSGKKEDLKGPEEFSKFLTDEKVTNIILNSAFFSKVSEKGEPVAGGGVPVKSSESSQENSSAIIQKLESMSLDSMIWEVIRQAFPNPEDQKRIYEVIFRQIQGELKTQIEKATHAIKEEKQVIANEQERTESVVQTVAEGVIVVDHEGHILMMNPVAEKIYGRNFTELKGKKIDELAGEELMITLSKELGQGPSDRAISKDMLIQSSLNTQRTIKQSAAMIQNPEGRVVGMMSVLTDIVRQRELQRMQDQFLANVTHELRSPLTAIKASLGTIASDEDLKFPDPIKNMLNIATRNIDRLARLINDILDFAKMTEGKISISTKPVDTKKLLMDTVTGLQPWAQTKQILLDYTPNGHVPRVMADSDRITQVLMNFLSNAVKFTPKGGKITLSTEAFPLSVKISVTDTGPGIPKNEQDKVFQKFFQMKQTTKMDVPGTGLGLYITKKIVELHEGEIGFVSEEGKGTTFWFTLPIVPESTVNAEAKNASTVLPKKKNWFSRLFGG